MEGGRRPVVVRPRVALLLETRAVLAHDRDGPKNELFDRQHDSLKAIRALDVRAGGRGWQLVDQLVQVNRRVIRNVRLRLWGTWRTSFELFDVITELRFLVLVQVRTDSCNVRLECHLRATTATEHGKNRTTTSSKSMRSSNEDSPRQ